MDPLSAVSEELTEIDGQIADIFRALSNGFQKLEKIKDSNRQSRQLEELTDKMRDCKRLIKEFDREVKNMERINDPNTSRMLNEKKQSMIKELNSYVALKKQYASNLENKKIDLFDGPAEDFGEQNVLLASGKQISTFLLTCNLALYTFALMGLTIHYQHLTHPLIFYGFTYSAHTHARAHAHIPSLTHTDRLALVQIYSGCHNILHG